MRDRSGNHLIEVYDERYKREVEYISTHLRKEDFDEVYAIKGDSPHYDVLRSWDLSAVRWMIFNKKALPAAVLGVITVNNYSDIGVPWFLGTDRMDNMKKFFITASRPVIKTMSSGYSTLINYVDARYIKTLRWLEWLGFVIEKPEPYGKLGLPFHKCIMECK